MKRSVRKHPTPGSQFPRNYKGDMYTMKVVEMPEGIKYQIQEYPDELFTSPTKAAEFLVPDGQSVNGRSFWKVDG